MTRPLRVLHIIQNLNYGGMERLVSDLVRVIDRDRFDVHILTLEYAGRFADGLDAYATLHRGDPLPRTSMLWPGPLVRQIRRIDPNVVHTHSGVWYKATRAARAACVPRIVHTEHGRPFPDPWLHRILDSRGARRTDVVVAVSDRLARQLAESVVGDPDRIRVIRNGVDTARFRPRPGGGALRRELGLPDDAPIIGSVGRLEPVKAYDRMVDAVAALRARWTMGTPPVLVIAGDGSERPKLARRARELRLEGAVHLLGWRDDVHELHAAFTLFALSSHSEGTSVSLLEAMAAGVCPVVTDVGGNSTVLGPELRHRLAHAGDPVALAAAWRVALADPEARSRDARAASERVVRHFSLETTVRAYERVYECAAPPRRVERASAALAEGA